MIRPSISFRCLVIFASVWFYSFSAFAQSVDDVIIRFYRPRAYGGSLVNFRIVIADTLCFKLHSGGYFEYRGPRPDLIGTKSATLPMPDDGRKEYYICVGILSGLWSASTELILVDTSFGERKFKELVAGGARAANRIRPRGPGSK